MEHGGLRTSFKMILAALILAAFWGQSASAACTGSGLSWSCPAGSTDSDVNSALTNAASDATITFANGSYSWSSSIQMNNSGAKGVTLICASVRGCSVTYSGGGVFYKDTIAGTSSLVRISGFVFNGSPGTAVIWLYGAGTMSKLRIDNNTFQSQATGSIGILLGETSSASKFYGVVDHNIFTGATNFMGFKNLSGGSVWVTGQQGGGNSMYFEDNQCSFTSYPDSGTGCVDDWLANSTVLRFNTVTNSRFVNHSYCHGGPYNSEIYGNRISNAAFTVAPNYRNIHFQGSGEEMAWGNQVEDNGNAIVVQHFRSDSTTATSEGSCNSLADGTASIDGNRTPIATYRGYPAWHQPGRDNNGTLKPMYLWRNRTAAGAMVKLQLNSGGYMDQEYKINRDYYEAVSLNAQTSPTAPFNGTSGMGFGTLANRPATCTPTPEALDSGQGGVGYWATDAGSWKSAIPSQGVDVENGVLFSCSAPNTWIVHYTPYAYPHPLVAGSGTVADVMPPAKPQGFSLR